MKIIINIIMVSISIIGINVNAAGKNAINKATASINASCRMAISPMSFGDVTMQAMSGNGDITAQTNLNLTCTKDANVTLQTNNGMNGVPDSTTFNYQNAQLQRTAGNQLNGFYNASAQDVANLISLGHSDKLSGYSSSSQVKYGPYQYWRVVYTDGGLIPVGATPPRGTSNMASGSNKIAYGISTTNGGPYITTTTGSPLTYTNNDGTPQTFILYGRASVKQAAPGTYVDTNTLTVTF